MVSDFFSGLAYVGTSSVHAFVSHDTHSKIVDIETVIDSTHYLWSHVTRCARCILRIFRTPQSGDSKVSYPEVAIMINDQVLWLDVSVDDILLVACFQSRDEAGTEELYRKIIQI